MANQYKNKVVFGNETLIDLTEDTVEEGALLAGYTAHDRSGRSITGTVTTASPSDTNPTMDGTASAGSSELYSRGDHVHPKDTSKQDKITASGLLKGNGSGVVTAAVAGTDYQAPISNNITGSGTSGSLAKFDAANTLISGPEFGEDTNTFLRNDGVWSAPLAMWMYDLPMRNWDTTNKELTIQKTVFAANAPLIALQYMVMNKFFPLLFFPRITVSGGNPIVNNGIFLKKQQQYASSITFGYTAETFVSQTATTIPIIFILPLL